MVKKLLALSPAALKRAILEAKQQDSGVESKKKKKKREHRHIYVMCLLHVRFEI